MSEKVVDWGKQTQTEEIEKAIGQLESWRADYAALRKEVPRLRAKNAGLSQNFTKVHYENAELLKENKKLKSCLVAAQQIYKEISNTLTQNFDYSKDAIKSLLLQEKQGYPAPCSRSYWEGVFDCLAELLGSNETLIQRVTSGRQKDPALKLERLGEALKTNPQTNTDTTQADPNNDPIR